MAGEKRGLDGLYEELLTYVYTSGLRVFPGTSVHESSAVVFRWDGDRDDWKAFVDLAREAGAACLVVHSEKGSGVHSDVLGRIEMSWAKDGAVYSFVREEEWWSTKESKQEWSSMSDDQLAEEVLRFAESTYRRGEVPSMEEVSHDYWSSLGVSTTFSQNPDLRMRMARVGKLAEEKLVSRERELAAGLVDEVVEWSKRNEIRRVSQGSMDAFLSQKGMGLTKQVKKELCAMVNFKLSE